MNEQHPQLAFIESLFTPLVSDTMDRMGISGQIFDRSIQSIPFDSSLKVAGFAYPCRVVPTNEYIEIDKLLEMIDSIPKNAIVLVAADNDIDAALWGGLMSSRAIARGARAAIVNGGVRDFEQIAQLGFPVFGTYRTVTDIRRRGFMHSYNVPITIGGVCVSPGDLIFGDANGVVSIPQTMIAGLMNELDATLTGETKTALGLEQGMPATELFKNFKTF
jgi:4-hydroxy-4-methyl-2-oxoglutarate aldolase